jgi:hypothetical protein
VNLPRRKLLHSISAAFCATLFEKAGAQEQGSAPQTAAPRSGTPRFDPEHPLRGTPYEAIENAASVMKAGDSDSVRGTVEALFKFPNGYRMPPIMEGVVKQRLIDAQTAYLDGKTTGVADGAVVEALNALATAFDTPEYARVSLLQVRFFRSGMASLMPVFMQSAPDTRPDEPNPPMSPLQAIFHISQLIDQKLINPDYQATPAEWDRDFYPRLLEERRARQELQRRIKAGEVQPKIEARLVVGSLRSNDLENLVFQRIRAMSVTDGLKLFNETFARLGIK